MANTVLLEARPYRPFKSSEEYLYAMREDLAEWMNIMYPELRINTDNFMDRLDTGVTLCKHANNVRKAAEEYLVRRQARNKSMTKSMTTGLAGPILAIGNIHFLPAAKSGTFFARDNVSNFISWCRKSLQIFECLLFETDDLIMRKNEKHVILCLLEVARRGAKFGMLAPMLVQMERQIDREIAADNRAMGVGCGTQTENGTQSQSIGTDNDDLYESDSENEDDSSEPMLMYGPQPQIITNDLKSLDEMVRDLVEKCTCPSQFPMVRVSEGKYRIGDTKVLIFVRILRSHVMVRVGGGWDTLSHYLDKHDPCRCRAQHRSSHAARLITKTNHATNGIELHKAQVFYERSPPVTRKTANSVTFSQQQQQNNNVTNNQSPNLVNANLGATLSPPARARSRSRSSTPQRRTNVVASSSAVNDGTTNNDQLQITDKLQPRNPSPRRSVSPSPRRITETKTKQLSLESAVPPYENVVQTLSNDSKATDPIVAGGDGKFENISDNGSEISDEGYRSLGIIQANNMNGNNQTKRTSLHSQTSTEDAEPNVRLDQTSSDSQISPIEDTDTTTLMAPLSDVIDNHNETNGHNVDSDEKIFEQSGIYITDDDITIDIATTTGLRKTGFSANLYGDEPIVGVTNTTDVNKPINSKIPRSPMPTRRNSIDNSNATTAHDRVIISGGGNAMSRKMPVYRSVRKPAISTVITGKNTSSTTKEINNTWNGRSTKKRPSLQADTFQQQPASTTPTNGNSPLNRNSPNRSSTQNLYDKNGRRIKSTNTSPNKTACTSPLAQQILVAAGTAKNDSQMLEKMKELLNKYTKKSNGTSTAGTAGDGEFDDFTTAWVNSNGTLDRAVVDNYNNSPSSSSPTKVHSKRSSAASSIESLQSRGDNVGVGVIPRRDRGLSKIPAPIRQNTELY